MSIKTTFETFGTETPHPPTVVLPTPPQIGDEFEYINNDRNTISTVKHIRYIIKSDEVSLLVTLQEKETER